MIEKTCIKQLYITSHISSLILCSTLIFLTKDFCSLAFLLSLPFNFKDQLAYSALLRSAASEKECITKPFILSSIFFLFFQQNKLKNLKKNKNTSPDIQSLRRKHIMHNKHDKSLHRFEKTPYKLTVLLTHVIERIDKLKSFFILYCIKLAN